MEAEGTRERILAAALAEFGAKGYAGARTAAIGARAGVNPQLISYYFGGKQGLLDALRQRWAAAEPAHDADVSFADALAAYLDATLDDPDWARLVVWQALGDDPGGADPAAVQRARLRPAVARMRKRQKAGEVTSAVEPEFALLLAYAVAFAPISMPHIVAGIFGVDPYSPAYRRRCLRQLLTLLTGEQP
jgi:TetR/AcrR family transcriptional regulator